MSRKRKTPAPPPGRTRQAGPAPRFWEQLPPWVLAAFAALLTAAVYARTADFGFVNLDDGFYVTENARVLAGLTWENLRWALQDHSLSYWHPLTWLSFMLDRSLFGGWAGGFHLVNAALHCGNVVLLFFLCLRWFTLARVGGRWAALAVALAFGLHPVHVESVAWVTERKDVLFMLFGLISLHCYTSYATGRERSLKGLGPALLAYGASLACKPMLVTLPALLLVLDFWPLGRFGFGPAATGEDRAAQPTLGALLLEKVPFLLLAAAVTATTLLSHPAYYDPFDPSLSLKLANAVASYLDYLRLLVFPAGLAVFYPFPQAVPAAKLGAAVLILCGVTALAVREARRRPFLLAGWLWFLGTLAPVLLPPKVGMRIAYGDRFAYFPFLGLYLALALLGWETLRRLKDAQVRQRAAAAALLAVCVLPATLSFGQLDWWKSGFTLYERALAVTEGNYFVMRGFGALKLDRGELREGEKWVRAALELQPGYGLALVTLGNLYTTQNRFAEAVPCFSRALANRDIESSGLAFEAHYGLAYGLGQLGRLEEAEAQYRRTLDYRPDFAQAYNDLGSIAILRNQPDLAEQNFQKAVSIAPGFALAQANLERARAMRAAKPGR